MPQVILASTASSASTVSPPPAAFQPSIRILKRPSATSNSQPVTSAAADAQQKSFVQREADYQLARERIFGGSSSQAETTASSVLRNDTETSRARRDTPGSPPIRIASPTITTVVRNPRGPDTTAPGSSKSIPVKGFKNRKPQGPPSSN